MDVSNIYVAHHTYNKISVKEEEKRNTTLQKKRRKKKQQRFSLKRYVPKQCGYVLGLQIL